MLWNLLFGYLLESELLEKLFAICKGQNLFDGKLFSLLYGLLDKIRAYTSALQALMDDEASDFRQTHAMDMQCNVAHYFVVNFRNGIGSNVRSYLVVASRQNYTIFHIFQRKPLHLRDVSEYRFFVGYQRYAPIS